ncbi:MAG: histidine--tRNA ligase [Pseudomonadota bacterium]
MTKKQKNIRPKARLPKGFIDSAPDQIYAMQDMLAQIKYTYESYGFEPLDTPAIEYTDALGKFLPDQDRPNAGVFSFQDDDEKWVSLRYDLTAPLARYVAEHYDQLPKPFRRYQTGPVWRNEKPGPGRFRQFTQFDADTVGTTSVAADAELCMLLADCLANLGIPRGAYNVRLSNRKILDGLLLKIGLDPFSDENSEQKLTVLRAIDKLDRLGGDGVALLLGEGRKDDSGDFTKGAGLSKNQIDVILSFVSSQQDTRSKTLEVIEKLIADHDIGVEGINELRTMDQLLSAAGFEPDQICIDPGIVRGLDYYTGPVFEAELNFQSEDASGTSTRFGSVGGGGRYDGLVARFKGTKIPATGFAIGVSRLYSALEALGKLEQNHRHGPVIVLVMDFDCLADYQNMTRALRNADIKAEMYVGTSGMRAQMKYADKRKAPCVVIQGEDERNKGIVTIKDMVEGIKLSDEITDNKDWREGRPAQFSIPQEELVEAVRKTLISQNEINNKTN